MPTKNKIASELKTHTNAEITGTTSGVECETEHPQDDALGSMTVTPEMRASYERRVAKRKEEASDNLSDLQYQSRIPIRNLYGV